MEIDKSNGCISVRTRVGSELKQRPNITVKERLPSVFSAIYAKDALKNLSSTESHYFEFEIYLEKHSNQMRLEYFIDSSNLVPRASISFFITDIRYKKGDQKARRGGRGCDFHREKLFLFQVIFLTSEGNSTSWFFKIYCYKTAEVLKYLSYSLPSRHKGYNRLFKAVL